MKSILFRLYLAVMKFLARWQKEDPNTYVILNGAGRSGSNGYLFYKYLRREHPEVTAYLIEPWPSSHLPWSDWQKIGRAKYVLTTHQPFKVRKSQVNLALWHGIPLKRMGTMANNTQRRDNQRNEKLWHKTADLVTSSSELYESLMSACMGIEGPRYVQLGFPRIDSLLKSPYQKDQLLADFFSCQDPEAQVGIYVPTFRYELDDPEVMERIKEGNFFAFSDFDLAALDQALAARKQYLLVKLHPWEMKLFSDFHLEAKHVAFLNNSDLLAKKLDLYEILGATDFLMTDFSSIYFDYLHLDKPLIFITNYLAQYEKTRGFLLGPYEKIVPGPCVASQADLVKQLGEKDKYGLERKKWLELSDQADHGQACQTIFDYLSGV